MNVERSFRTTEDNPTQFLLTALAAICFLLFAAISIATNQLERYFLTFGLPVHEIQAVSVDPKSPISLPSNDGTALHFRLDLRVTGTLDYPNLLQTDDVNSGLRIELSGTTMAALYPLGGKLDYTILTNELELGRWYHLDVDIGDAAYLSLSLDGAPLASNGTPHIGLKHIVFGSGFSSTRPFQGEIRNLFVSQSNVRPVQRTRLIVLGLQGIFIILFALNVGIFARSAASPTVSDVRLYYRPDIDGLRAISIISVLAYHAFPSTWSGGFVGVDIFFVISGYLITQIIIEQLSAGTFSLVSFYRRRISRIFPALTLVLLVTYAIGWFRLLPADLERLSLNTIAGATFVANLLLLRQPDYFAPDAATNPLLHLWSLGIEEQFYIFWPLILIALAKYRRNLLIFGSIAAVSFLLCLWVVSQNQTIAFYAPLTRSWELLAGAILSELHRRRFAHPSPYSYLVRVKASLGISLIALPIILLSKSSSYPSWNTLLPVLGACLLLDAPSSFLNARILSSRPMVFIGLISYPLYLWHWPILTFLNLASDDVPPASNLFIALSLAFGLAWATYVLVEKPIRTLRFVVPKLLAASVAVCALCVLTIANSGFDFRIPSEVRQIGRAHFDEASSRTSCFRYAMPGAEKFGDDCVEKGKGPLIVIWGDSTAATYYAGLKALQNRHAFRIGQFTAPGCRPMMGPVKSNHTSCEKVNDSAFREIQRTAPQIVMLKGLWSPEDVQVLDGTVAALKAIKVPRIILVGPDPWFGTQPPPDFAFRYYRTHLELPPERVRGLYIMPPHEAAMKQFANEHQIEYISPRDAICNDQGCVFRVGREKSDLLAFDTSHLTGPGAEFFLQQIEDKIFPSVTQKLGN